MAEYTDKKNPQKQTKTQKTSQKTTRDDLVFIQEEYNQSLLFSLALA